MSLVLGSTGAPAPQVLSSVTDDVAAAATYFASGAAGSAVYPAANQAYFVPFRLAEPHTYTKAWWLNGAAVAGNVDVGIYTLSGTTLTRVVASTAEAQATVSVMQVAATFTTTTIGPGNYYLAISCTSGTAQFWKTSFNALAGRAQGLFQVATASPLPASATAATWVASAPVLPVFGLSELSTV